ncbi:glycosyltransferase family 4 protein [Prosthecobacter vanneervenii]|uniref:Glycosyltransferase involved in cell wall biosynthesis n=1 Tax=Prosthecobacter vanneervenii TaxID=48466 RepID=A0A7W7Y9Q1_9BACT|nr:glycosyltransferase family 4 protein [Prosthecobacter vanneervenii]MBB5032218.1 glycosyltransferase involved in cell wall biosynthesis [Prosthecobacter vanneervenii]
MKILVLTNLYPPHYVGGYELRCAAISEALRARGHDVQVLTSNHGLKSGETTAEPWIERTLRIHGYYGHPWLGLPALKKLELHNNETLRNAMAFHKPDVVHVWCMGGLSKSLCLTLQRSGVPAVYDVSDHWILRSLKGDVWLDWWNRRHGSPGSRMLRLLWTLAGVRRRCDPLAPTGPVSDIRFQRLYFTSARLRELTAQQGYDVMHGGVIHCPVDTSQFKGEPVTRAPKNWLWVGRLAEDKGILTALRALLLIRPSFGGELHVYGRGDEAYVTMLKNFASGNSLPVTWHSATPPEMPDVYRAHDALLFTSEWEEPFALTPLEAMACGLPVIGTMTGGSRELFRHGENALTYEAGAATELSERILQLQSEDHLRTYIARNGHTEVHKRFAMNPIVDQVEKYLCDSIPS